MDSSNCKIEVEKVNKSSGMKRSSTESFPAGTKDQKRIKRDSVIEIECIEEEQVLVAEDVLKTPEKKKISLSRAISYNPAQFGGIKALHQMSPSPESKLIKSPTKSAADRFRSTPTKQKRNLTDSPLPPQ